MNKKTKLIVFGVLTVAVAIVSVMFVRPWFQDRTVAVTVNETIERPALNIAFTFPSGEAGYSFLEPVLEENASDNEPEAAFIMILSEAYMKFQEAPAGGEAPPSMSLFVFAKPAESTSTVASGTPDIDRITRLRNWTVAHEAVTSYSLAKDVPVEVDIDGVQALHYQTEGLYQQDVYVAFNKGRYYLIVGQYDGEADPARATFQELVKSITFM